MTNNNTMISCSFKLAYTCLTKTYNFRRNIPVSRFFSQLKSHIRRDFNLEVCHIVDTDYRLQNSGYVGPSEEAPPVSLNELYEKIYNNNNSHRNNGFTFYLRYIPNGRLDGNAIQTMDEPREATQEIIPETSEETTTIIECMLCQSEVAETNYFGCSHLFCNNCILGCQRSSISRCPFCRNSRVNAI